MRKYFYLLMMAIMAISFQACSSDDDSGNGNKLEKNYLTIENAIYKTGTVPNATTSEVLEGVNMSNQVMNGAMNFITVTTKQKISKFFIAIVGVKGYYEYVARPTGTSDYYTYIIPVMISQAYKGNATLIICGLLESGDVTASVENELFYIETMPGEVEIKLAFSNNKDVDLHLFTPSGTHIYYGDRGGTYTNDQGKEITFGLDVDSNADCRIDGINKENIYLPSELVEDGEYKVVVDMFKNCDISIPTSWSVVVRYQGELIRPSSGANPASGVYPVGAENRDMSTVMTFKINKGTRSSIINRLNDYSFKPIPLTDSDEMKLLDLEYSNSGK